MLRFFGGWLAAMTAVLLFVCPSSQAAEPPQSVSILLYHRLGPEHADDMTVTTTVVESQLKLIQERGYHVIPLKSLLATLADPAAPLPELSVLLTAVEVHKTDSTHLYPLIIKYTIPATR